MFWLRRQYLGKTRRTGWKRSQLLRQIQLYGPARDLDRSRCALIPVYSALSYKRTPFLRLIDHYTSATRGPSCHLTPKSCSRCLRLERNTGVARSPSVAVLATRGPQVSPRHSREECTFVWMWLSFSTVRRARNETLNMSLQRAPCCGLSLPDIPSASCRCVRAHSLEIVTIAGSCDRGGNGECISSAALP
ncbi:hypothetical protein NEOLEDRAFT_171892 [Neolentinus lepideus HHB14362 ss-1]|uniref:Uncharacterized protein n=1 Tax=Neolentinus lepideus HHB14362 ss-1 TaxID=1314782 RepID=A0A165MIR8_9AGAM|nr:hypothetical protein NEOLEDRAFT_171892 [Neolentinus lepideus HHB14362 ss-1]